MHSIILLRFSKEGRSSVGGNFVKKVVHLHVKFRTFLPRRQLVPEAKKKKGEAVRNQTHNLSIGHGDSRSQPVG
jgi:hypothetical protein